jgi:hypothetical protein
MYYNIAYDTLDNSHTQHPVMWGRIDVKPSDKVFVRAHDVTLCLKFEKLGLKDG